MRFRQEQPEAIADTLGDTDEALKNSEIDFLLESAKLKNPVPARSATGFTTRSSSTRTGSRPTS